MLSRRTILIVLGAIQALLIADTSIMGVSISAIQRTFGTDHESVKLAVSLYALVFAGMLLLGGKLVDRFGEHRMLAIGLAIRTIGAFGAALAPNLTLFILFESVVEGIGAGLLMPALVASTRATFSSTDRNRAFGMMGAATGAAYTLSPIIGGWFATSLSWRYVFGIEAFILLLSLLAVRRFPTGERPEAKGRLDVIGAILFIASVVTIIIGINSALRWGWLFASRSPIRPLGLSLAPLLIALGSGLFVLFLRHEVRVSASGHSPLIELDLLRNRLLRVSLLVLTNSQIFVAGLFFIIPVYLEAILGMSPLDVGIRMAPLSIASFIASILWTRLAGGFNVRLVLRFGLAMLAVGAGLLGWTVTPSMSGDPFVIAMICIGIGISITSATLSSITQMSVPDSEAGQATGIHLTTGLLGTAFGAAIIGSLVLGGLSTGVTDLISRDLRIEESVRQTSLDVVSDGVTFVSIQEATKIAANNGVAGQQAEVIIGDYRTAQFQALQQGFAVIAALAVSAQLLSRRVPKEKLEKEDAAASSS